MIIAALFFGVCNCIIQVLNDQNTLIVQSILQNMMKIRGYILLPSSSMLNSILWSGPDFIINAHDPI